MANFQTTTIIVAVVIYILFILFAWFMMTKKSTQTWPPLVGECPDYWVDMSGNGAKCVNTKNLGTCQNNRVMDFTVSPYNGTDDLCQKYTWATGCGLTWDGITSGVTNPCDPSGNTV